jgi:hypothetical protein
MTEPGDRLLISKLDDGRAEAAARSADKSRQNLCRSPDPVDLLKHVSLTVTFAY